MQPVRIGLYQYTIDANDPSVNLDKIRNAALQASREHTDILILPELCLHGYNYRQFPNFSNWFSPAIEKEISLLAASNRISICGTFVTGNAGNHQNTLLLWDKNGQICYRYPKIHLFNLLGEGSHFSAGSSINIYNTGNITLGGAICYDLRFPEMFRRLAALSARLIMLPAEWPIERLEHWITLIRARAIENQVFIAAVNCVGQTLKTEFGGHSMIVDPWGNVVADLGEEADKLLTCQIDMDEVDHVRQEIPVWNDLRNDLY